MRNLYLFQSNPYKLIISKFFIFSVAVILCIANIFSQWQPDVRLTNDPAQSYMSGPFQRDIASSGNVLHVVWHDQRSNWDIYYKRSSDAGISWGADTRLSNGPAESHSACVAISGTIVHVLWCDTRDGHWELFYIRSTDIGLSWGTETRFTTNDGFDSPNPVVGVTGSIVHVTWQDNRDGNYELYYKRSTNDGVTWGSDTRLTNNPSLTESVSTAVSGNYVHSVWYDNRDGNYEIYYKRSTDAGITWGADTRLSSFPYVSEGTHVDASGSNVHVVWQDARDGSNLQIYYRRSTDAGTTWGTETRLTNNTSYAAAPSVTASGLITHVTWQDNRDGNFEVYYKRSTDVGISWGPETRLTNAGGNSLRTFTTVSGTAVHLVFMDERMGNWEIFYKQDPTGNPISQPPPAPNLVSPPNWSTIYTTTPLLDWDSLSSVNYYRVQIAADSVFTFILFDTVGVINSSCSVPNGELTPGSTYFWRVRATNTAGNSPWSVIWRFYIALGPPAPILVAPPNGSYNQPSTVRFIWNKSFSALTYRLQVALDSSFTNLVVNDSTLTDSTIVVTNLTVNRYYWWRVNAKNAVGTSPYSAVWRFGTFFVGLNQIGTEIPKEYKLFNNYPNPFNPVTKIKFDLPPVGAQYIEPVQLIIYDILGREIASLIPRGQQGLQPGTYEVDFDGSNYPSGIYFYTLTTETYTNTKRMVLIK